MSSHNSGSTYEITITTSPTLIKGHDVEPRNSLVLANISNVTVYLGYDPEVTIATGFPFIPNERMSEDNYHGWVFGIVETGTAELRVKTY